MGRGEAVPGVVPGVGSYAMYFQVTGFESRARVERAWSRLVWCAAPRCGFLWLLATFSTAPGVRRQQCVIQQLAYPRVVLLTVPLELLPTDLEGYREIANECKRMLTKRKDFFLPRTFPSRSCKREREGEVFCVRSFIMGPIDSRHVDLIGRSSVVDIRRYIHTEILLPSRTDSRS